MQFIPVIKAQFSASLLCNDLCHMILQKSFYYTNFLLNKHVLSMLKTVMIQDSLSSELFEGYKITNAGFI